jgi:hypothetical protein
MFSIDNYHKLYGQAKEHYIVEVQIDTNNAIRELLSFIKDQAKPALPATGSTEYVDSLKQPDIIKGVESAQKGLDSLKPKGCVVSAKKSKKSKKPKKD